MKQCRMCSQRLTRPGRLCRECERELDRARHAGVTVGELAPEVAVPDASRVAGFSAMRWPRTPGTLIAAAFAIGTLCAIALHALEPSAHAAVATDSVMLVAPPAPRHVPLVKAPIAARVARVREADPVRVTSVAPGVQAIAMHASPASEPGVARDAARTLDDALARCGEETFFARPACEERARARHCGAGSEASPRCVASARDYGQ